MILSPSPDLVYPVINTENTFRDRLSSHVPCPVGLPQVMWNSMQRIYNESQLKAIATVCLQSDDTNTSTQLNPSTSGSVPPSIITHYPFLLLQGPPGTGITFLQKK